MTKCRWSGSIVAIYMDKMWSDKPYMNNKKIHIVSRCFRLFREILKGTRTVCSVGFYCTWVEPQHFCAVVVEVYCFKSIACRLKQKASPRKQYFGDFQWFPLFKRAATLKEKKVFSSMTAAFVELNVAQIESICRVLFASATNWIVYQGWKQMHYFR